MNDGGSVFPAKVFSHFEDGGVPVYTMSQGLSMRDHFAGLAMQGFIEWGATDEVTTAKASVRYADALMAELQREEEV